MSNGVNQASVDSNVSSFSSNNSSAGSSHADVDHDHDLDHPMVDQDHDALLNLRVVELEKKIIDQADEIVCLKSTLADVLRRVNQLEGRASVITSNNHVNQPNHINNYNNNHINNNQMNNNNGYKGSPMRMNGNHTSSPYNTGRALYQSNRELTHHNNNANTLSTSVPPRRFNHLNSQSSTNSQQSEGHSSNSGSPIPSPSPSQHRASISNVPSTSPMVSPRHAMRISQSASTSNLTTMRKWSASQEFRGNNMSDLANRRVTSGSLFNLHALRHQHSHSPSIMSNNHVKHGTKEATYNQEDGIIRIYLRGHPLVMHIPTDLLQSYTLNKVNSPPSQRLKLEWVYGYRGRDCRHNLYLLPTGEMVYFIAAVVVLYNVEDQIQRHYLGHTDDIKCLTIHPNRLLIATGQTASLDRRERRPHVRIWDSVSLNTLHIIGMSGEFERGISCLAFSKLDGGSLLCVVDDSNDHTISLWDWQRGEIKQGSPHKVTETKSSSEQVLAVEFHPMDRFALITIGKGHIHFWDIEGGTMAKKLGTFEKSQDKPKYVLCIAYTDMGECLTGDSNGAIMCWPRGMTRPSRTIHNAHEGGVFSLCVMKDGMIVTGGGKDRRIIEWDNNLNRTGREAKLPEQFGGVRTLTQGKGSMLLVGTTKNCILQGTLSLNFSLVAQGHTEELWALAVHPTQNQFITAGYDKSIHLWDTMSHSVVWSKDIGESAQAACFSPDGNVLVVSSVVGRWIVLDANTRQLISMHSDGNEPISCVKFSSDGRFLALGSHDNHVYVYQVSEEFHKFNRIGRCSGHSSYITQLDWTSEGTYLQTTSGDYELLFWNATTCRQVSNMSIARDLKWETQNCTLGFNVFGLWPENADGTDVNSCDRSNSHKLLATGDDFGKVNIYSFPSSQPKCLHHTYPGHSSHVTAVRFLKDDSRLISLGGKDCSIMQWTVA